MKNLDISFKKFNLKSGGRLFGFGNSPESDWKVIFISSAFLAILFIIFCIIIFIKIENKEIFVSEETSESAQEEQLFETAVLKDTASYYQSKAREFEEMKNIVIPVVDPSL